LTTSKAFPSSGRSSGGRFGHEEIYAVIAGRATFTVDGETVDAPAGTLVYLDDPKQKRHAVATEAGTTVLAIGGVPGTHEISPWEYFFPALPAIEAHDYDTARNILADALRELDHSALHYHLARVEALAGNEECARAELAKCSQRHQDAFAELELLPG